MSDALKRATTFALSAAIAAASGAIGCGNEIPSGAEPLPVQVVGLKGARSISAGSTFTCAADNDGRAFCWGSNWSGALGDGTNLERLAPVRVGDLSGVTSIAAGSSHACATLDDGSGWCWGQNSGSLGDDTSRERRSPVQVVDLSGARSITAGSGHTCAVEEDGRAWCWGGNYFGAVGDGSTKNTRLAPFQVDGLTDAAQISAGNGHSCAIRADGTAWCWGLNSFGVLGDGTEKDRPTPVKVSGIDDVRSIATGYRHACAVRGDGTVWCWGLNQTGVLGVAEDDLERSLVPRKVDGISGVASIAVGSQHTCAVRSAGDAWCWGHNWAGQLGDGSADDRYEPERVENLSGVVAISAGNSHSCAVLSDGTAWCWGNNSSGELGIGSIPE